MGHFLFGATVSSFSSFGKSLMTTWRYSTVEFQALLLICKTVRRMVVGDADFDAMEQVLLQFVFIFMSEFLSRPMGNSHRYTTLHFVLLSFLFCSTCCSLSSSMRINKLRSKAEKVSRFPKMLPLFCKNWRIIFQRLQENGQYRLKNWLVW